MKHFKVPLAHGEFVFGGCGHMDLFVKVEEAVFGEEAFMSNFPQIHGIQCILDNFPPLDSGTAQASHWCCCPGIPIDPWLMMACRT